MKRFAVLVRSVVYTATVCRGEKHGPDGSRSHVAVTSSRQGFREAMRFEPRVRAPERLPVRVFPRDRVPVTCFPNGGVRENQHSFLSNRLFRRKINWICIPRLNRGTKSRNYNTILYEKKNMMTGQRRPVNLKSKF